MNTHAHPRPSRISDDAEFNDRFWFWQGASGRTYIHSVYPADQCPPLPGAIFIAVARSRSAGTCRALSCGRLDSFNHLSSRHADELHVHMLARDETDSAHILSDLQAALFGNAPCKTEEFNTHGFHEPQLPGLTAGPAAAAAC